MAYNYEAAHTDYGRYNNNWLLKKMKEVLEEWAKTLTEWNNTEAEWQELYKYVHDYFDNLNLQQEVNVKIDEMVANGTFQQILLNTPEIVALMSEMNTLSDKVDQIAQDQIPPEYVQQAIDSYITNNEADLILNSDLDDVANYGTGINIYDKNNPQTTYLNQAIDGAGQLVSNTAFLTVEGECISNVTYTIQAYIIANQSMGFKSTRIAFYNATGVTIQVSDGTTATSPQNSAKVRASILNDGTWTSGTIMITNITTIATKYYDFGGNWALNANKFDVSQVVFKKTDVKNIGEQNVNFVRAGINLIDDNSDFIDGFYIQNTNGLQFADPNFYCIRYFDISSFNTGKITILAYIGTSHTLSHTFHRLAFYDSSERYISGITNGTENGNPNGGVIDIPNGAYYVRFGARKVASVTNWVLSDGDVLGSGYLEYGELGNNPTDLRVEIDNLKSGGSKWKFKTWCMYGDSIGAISNVNGLNGGYIQYVNQDHNFGNFYGRSIGGQGYTYGVGGGSVTFVYPDGLYHSRVDTDNKDSYTGEIPPGTIDIRSCFSSWDRITHMIPEVIKNEISLIVIMGGTNNQPESFEIEPFFSANNTTDPEWTASEYYIGDYNLLDSALGGLLSTIMKIQIWCPNALLAIGTPLSGRGVQGQNNTDIGTIEYDKSLKIKEIANKMSIPIIDVYGTTGINGLNRINYISDTVHPYLDEGTKALARSLSIGIDGIRPKY